MWEMALHQRGIIQTELRWIEELLLFHKWSLCSIRQEMSAMFLFIVMEVKHVIPPQMHKWLVLLMSSKCSFVSNLNGIESNFLSLHAVATAL